MSATQLIPGQLRYSIDARNSRLTVQAFAGGIGARMAHNPKFAVREFEGGAEFAEDSLSCASFRFLAKPASIELLDEVSTKDHAEILRVALEEVLETQQYPEIAFESTAVAPTTIAPHLYHVVVIGNLHLHGITSSQRIAARVVTTDDQLRANGEFSLGQKAFGIKLVSVAGGLLKVKDELKFTFDMVARKQTSQMGFNK